MISEMEQWRADNARHNSVLIIDGVVEISDAAGIVGDYKRLKAAQEARLVAADQCDVSEQVRASWVKRNTTTLLTLLLAGGLLWTLPK
jgi:hypothetical protein